MSEFPEQQDHVEDVEKLIESSTPEQSAVEEVLTVEGNAPEPKVVEEAITIEVAVPVVAAAPAARVFEPMSLGAVSEISDGRNARKEKYGIVVSNKMMKTITVAVERRLKHPMYGKFIKKTTKFAVHDEQNDANVGDRVRIMETRPLSKMKRWRLVEIVERAK